MDVVKQLQDQVRTLEKALKEQRDVNRQLKKGNADLIAELGAWRKFGAGGAINYIEDMTEVMRQLNEYKQKVAELSEIVPPEMREAEIKPDQLMVGITMLLRKGDKFAIHSACNPDFPGGIEDALNEVLPAMTIATQRLPNVAEFSGHLERLEINGSILLILLNTLSPYRYGDDRQAYFNKRNAELKSLYDYLEMDYQNRNEQYKYSWDEFNDGMSKIIDRSFEAAKKRRAKVGTVEEILDSARQNLSWTSE